MLKCAREKADTPGMFFPRRNPSSPDPRRFAALRTSLNAPVVATEELPSGPARAAILLFFDAEGETSLEVRMHSISTGRVVVYAFEGTLDDAAEVETALEAALSFAESMGFLFDDDILSGDDTIGRGKVVAAWQSFEAGAEGPAGAAPSGPLPEAEVTRPGAAELEPLELTEMVAEDEAPATDGLSGAGKPGDDALNVELASGWSPESPEEQHSHDVPLTKFRGVAEEPEGGEAEVGPEAQADADLPGERDEAASAPSRPPPAASPSANGGRTALARLPLVRRRRGAGRPERPGLLARILGAF